MDDTVGMNHCSCRKRVRDEKEKRNLMNRLRRIEGQVRGLQRMLDEDAWCPDILTQTSAVNSALNSFCKTLLASHLRTGSRLKKKATTPSKKKLSSPKGGSFTQTIISHSAKNTPTT